MAAVERLLDAFWKQDADGAAQAVTDDFQFVNVPFAHRPLQGREALRETIANGNLGFPEPLEDCEHVIVHSFEDDGRVMHERVDRFKFRGRWLELAVAGYWEVLDGQVRLWKDYYDLGQYARMMASAGVAVDVESYYAT